MVCHLLNNELALVVGKDIGIGSFVEPYVDIEAQQDTLYDTENVVDNG